MKELSIKEKAEAYDKAIEELRDFYRDYDTVSGLIDVKEELANIFPEIKESKDEIIRQRIIHALHGDVLEMSEIKEAIDWLERQGKMDMKSYKAAEDEKREFIGDGFIKCYADFQDFKEGETYWFEYVGNDNYNVRSDNFLGKTYHITPCQLYTIFKKITWLEKQGKSALEAFDNINDKGYCCVVKKQDKSGLEATNVDNANKVEPKFKVRDWVMLDRPVLITKVEATPYNTHQYWTSDGTWFGDATKAHLWTIADANAGDVLATDGYIILFKKLLPHDGGVSYCHYDYACTNPHFDFNEDDNWLFNEKSGIIHPATKEQYDLLFAKMREAGYEWDTEKKELKKIDSKPIFDVEIPFGAKDSELEEVFYSIPNGFHAEIKDDKVVIKKGEQKSWSEEDEKTIDTIISFLKEFSSKDYIMRKHCINWLKSFKDRYTCKSSNEHYELEEFAKIVRCNLTGISKAVQKLFESKYIQLTGNKMYGGLKD